MKKALLIGINYTIYPEISLLGCIDDVMNIEEILINNLNYDSSDIIKLYDDYNNDPDSLPTYYNIISQLSAIIYETDKLEEIFILYSGHGSLIQDKNKPFSNKNVIFPLDYKEFDIINEYELIDMIQHIKCRAILLFDSCQSGSICDLRWSFHCDSSMNIIKTENISNPIFDNNNIYIFSGCKDDQSCIDTYDLSKNEFVGAFTTKFVDCIKSFNDEISIIELYKGICNLLYQSGYSQNPVLSSTNTNPGFITR